ncbi:uncharacterized protein LOC114805078 [Zeugodacus cucurbitae]|uniref:uncharacterized protein LOC114805078 n=1 Tax=Zeugodacus cucurbitae TaxID=28588 RepID=UPI0023D918E3|nr:uncharacterized protein LOC114805078 [Zeugodacus cucurbitae]
MTRESVLSSFSICDCREVVVLYQIKQHVAVGKAGGPGKRVQMDESNFGKRKYNKGRRVEGHRVLGIVENGSDDLRLEVCPDNVRSSEVLIPLIQNCLTSHGYEHRHVNHSDPDNSFLADDGTRTQRIESQWRVIKRGFIKDNYNNPENFSNFIIEYMWRKTVANKHEDPFIKLIDAIKYTYATSSVDTVTIYRCVRAHNIVRGIQKASNYNAIMR